MSRISLKRTAIAVHIIARKRRSAVLSAAVGSMLAKQSTRGEAIRRNPFSFSLHVQGISDTLFNRLYRMPKEQFFKLARLLTISRSQGGKNYSKSSPLLRLSLTLRWLAGGSYLDIAQAHGIHPSSLYFHLNNSLREMDHALKITFPYNDKQWLEQASHGFSRDGRSPLRGCCAALDGLAIKIFEPSRSEVGNTSTYYNRKGFFAINLQAACDHKFRIVFASALAAGSTHDSTAFAMSRLATLLNKPRGGLLQGYWVACDDAYCASCNCLTPWPGRNLSCEKDCFNYWQSSARIHIEQAFGLLVARWGILWRPIRFKFSNIARLVVVLCKLHNYIIDETHCLDIPSPSGMDSDYHTSAPDYTVTLQDECDTDDTLHRRRRDLESSDIRAVFTSEIKDAGLRRPSVY